MSAIRRYLTLLGLALIAAPAATAAPTAQPQITVVELEHNALGHRFSSKLPQATREPGGFEITSAADPEWLTLGFKIGDLIFAENGSPVGERLLLTDGIHLFSVIRNSKPVVVEVIIHPAARRSRTIDESQYDKLVDLVSQSDPHTAPLRNATGATGARVIDMLLGLYLECDVGDIIRTFDGNPIRTDADLLAAVKALKVGNSDVVLERLGRQVTLTLIRKAPLDLTGVKKISATKFELTRAFADAVTADRDLLLRKIETSPAVKNGRQHGFNVYNIAPDSAAGALGLLDGDIVLDFDGHSIDSFRDVMDTAEALDGASAVTVHIERKGKPLALVYTVK